MTTDVDAIRRIEQVIQLYVQKVADGVPAGTSACSSRKLRQDMVAFICGKRTRSATEEMILTVDRALTAIEVNSLAASRTMELRYFSSLDTQAIAIKVGSTVERVRRDTRFGRAILLQELKVKPRS